MAQKRRRRSKRRSFEPVAREARRMVRKVEKELSQLLSEALGFEVTVKVKRRPEYIKKKPGDTTSMATMERRGRRAFTVFDLEKDEPIA